MVVDLITIMNEGVEQFITNLQDNAMSTEHLNSLKEKGEYNIINPNNMEESKFENMIVTPKEIDELIENMSNVIARGINFAL